jgi:hypothetical protein
VNTLSFGKNRWAFMPTAAFTCLGPETGRELSAAQPRLLSLTLKNGATNYPTEPEFRSSGSDPASAFRSWRWA